MLLFSSRDHLSLPGICLWVLVTAVRLQCSYAFDILSPKTAAPSSLLPTPSSSSSIPPSFPTVSPFPSNFFSLLSPSSSSKLNSLLPNKFYVRYHEKHSKPQSSLPSLKRSIDAAKSSLSDTVFKRAVSRLIPHPPSSAENLISFTSGSDVRPLQNLKQSWSTKFPVMRQTTAPEIVQPSQISSIKEEQKLRSYFQQVEKIKSRKSEMRRRMKEKQLLKSKLFKAVNLKNHRRLTKMANVEAMALAKSPPEIQLSRSIKARRGGYLMHGHAGHSGTEGFENAHLPAGSYLDGFGGGDGFDQTGSAGVFHGFSAGQDTDGFVFENLPKDTPVDFVINSQGGFIPSSSSSDFLAKPSPSSSSLLSSPSSSFSPSAQSHFRGFQPSSDQNSFDSLLGSDAQPTDWRAMPAIQLPPKSHGFDMFAPSETPTSGFRHHQGGFHVQPHVDDSFMSSAWDDTKAPSSFSDAGDSFAPGFGSFQQDDRDCPTIRTKTCRSSRDCQCNGFFTCMGSRCVQKGSSSPDVGLDPLGGLWHDDPLMDSVAPLGGKRS